MRSLAAAGDQFVAHAVGERKIGDSVAVEVPELASAEAKLDAAERCVPASTSGQAATAAVICSAPPGGSWVIVSGRVQAATQAGAQTIGLAALLALPTAVLLLCRDAW